MNSGSYQLKIRVERDVLIKIGALGDFNFIRGIYVYTGSAMRNLAARVARHRRKEKKLRWHIDHLLASDGVELIGVEVFPSGRREECLRNQALIDAGGSIPVPGFGSSDCRRCPAHFVRIQEIPASDR